MNLSYLKDAFARRTSFKKAVVCRNSPGNDTSDTKQREMLPDEENQNVNKNSTTLVRCHSHPDSSTKKSKPGLFTTIRQKLRWKKRYSLKNKFKSQSSHELAYSVSEESSTESVLSTGSVRCRLKKGNIRSIHPTHTSVVGDYVDANIVNEIVAINPIERESPIKRSLTFQLLELPHCGWYWGPISREESENKLDGQPDGAFLVRDSSADHYLLSLSFRSYGRTLHTRIEHSNGLFSFYVNNSPTEQEGFGSVVELIEQSILNSKSGVFCYSRARAPGSFPYPVRLTKPISRFTEVRSLQYLCRFVIRQYIRVDNIQKLPLPNRLKGYVEESHY